MTAPEPSSVGAPANEDQRFAVAYTDEAIEEATTDITWDYEHYVDEAVEGARTDLETEYKEAVQATRDELLGRIEALESKLERQTDDYRLLHRDYDRLLRVVDALGHRADRVLRVTETLADRVVVAELAIGHLQQPSRRRRSRSRTPRRRHSRRSRSRSREQRPPTQLDRARSPTPQRP